MTVTNLKIAGAGFRLPTFDDLLRSVDAWRRCGKEQMCRAMETPAYTVEARDMIVMAMQDFHNHYADCVLLFPRERVQAYLDDVLRAWDAPVWFGWLGPIVDRVKRRRLRQCRRRVRWLYVILEKASQYVFACDLYESQDDLVRKHYPPDRFQAFLDSRMPPAARIEELRTAKDELHKDLKLYFHATSPERQVRQEAMKSVEDSWTAKKRAEQLREHLKKKEEDDRQHERLIHAGGVKPCGSCGAMFPSFITTCPGCATNLGESPYPEAGAGTRQEDPSELFKRVTQEVIREFDVYAGLMREFVHARLNPQAGEQWLRMQSDKVHRHEKCVTLAAVLETARVAVADIHRIAGPKPRPAPVNLQETVQKYLAMGLDPTLAAAEAARELARHDGSLSQDDFHKP